LSEEETEEIDQLREAKNAPFSKAISSPGSFLDKFARMYYRCFGPYALASAILEKEDLLGGFYYQLLTPFLLEIRDFLTEPLCYLIVYTREEWVRIHATHTLLESKNTKSIPILISSLSKLGELDHRIIGAIAKLTNEEGGIEELLKCLKDKDYKVRVATVGILGRVKSKEAVEGLISALKDKNTEVRREAVKQLLYLKEKRAVEALIGVVKDAYEEEDVRILAAQALGEIQDPRSYLPLKECLWGNISGKLEYTIRDALAKIPIPTPSPEEIPKLIQKLRSAVERDATREINDIEKILIKAGPMAINHLLPIIKNKKDKSRLRYSAFYIVSYIKDRRLSNPSLEIAKDEKESTWIRLMAFAVLGKLKAKEASNLLISILTDVKRTENLRSGAALDLGKMGERRAIEPLYFTLKLKPSKLTSKWEYDYYDSEYLSRIYNGWVGNLREASARALAMIGKPALERIKDALADDDPDVREAMVNALAWKKDESLKGLLLPLKDDKNIEVKLAVARALIEYEDPQFLDIVLSILKDKKINHSRKGEGILLSFYLWKQEKHKQFKDRRFVEPLLQYVEEAVKSGKALDHPDLLAIGLLGEIGDASAVKFIAPLLYSKDEQVRAATLDSLWKIGTLNEIVKDLIYVSKNDQSSSLRILALKCLSKVNNAEAVNAIVEAVKFDPEWGVRMEAAEILANLRSPYAVENLAKFLIVCKDEHIIRKIAWALKITDLKRASEVITPYLKDKDPKVRKLAAEALGYLQSPYGVEELLELMTDEDKEVREAARGALREIAHNDYGEDVGKWRIWWERERSYLLKQR